MHAATMLAFLALAAGPGDPIPHVPLIGPLGIPSIEENVVARECYRPLAQNDPRGFIGCFNERFGAASSRSMPLLVLPDDPVLLRQLAAALMNNWLRRAGRPAGR